MAIYSYSARDDRGKVFRGRVEAITEKEAVSLIRERGLFLVSLSKSSLGSFGFSNMYLKKVSYGDIVTFTRQLSTMVTAGLQLQDALALLKMQSTKPAFTDMVSQISRDIQAGNNLATALSHYPNQFSSTYIALTRAGETSGTLELVLSRLADNLEKDQEFRSRVKGAMVYPTIIMIAMVIVFIVMMIFVVPKLTELYASFDVELPLPTKILQVVSDISVRYWWMLIILAVVGWTLFNKWKSTTLGKNIWDGFLLKIPILGPLIKQVMLVEFTRTLGMLVGSGVHILDSLNILVFALDNIHFQDALKEITKKVEKGVPLGVLFAQNPLFPPILAQMVKVGEETGKLDESLIKLSSYFERESDHMVKALTTAIEPLIMIVLGIGVGFLVFSVITPLYKLTSSF